MQGAGAARTEGVTVVRKEGFRMISSVARSAAALAAVVFLSMASAPVAHAGLSFCGDSSADFGEGCDDGDTESFDGCSSNCLVETGFPCGASPFETGDASCESGICDETQEPDGVCVATEPTTSTTVTTTSTSSTTTSTTSTTSSTTSTTLIDSTTTTVDTTTSTIDP